LRSAHIHRCSRAVKRSYGPAHRYLENSAGRSRTGEITLIQELPDGPQQVALRAGEYAINPRGVWHTADVAGHATALFITAGAGAPSIDLVE
jgi:hypothetical protein